MDIKQAVREEYGKIARDAEAGCCSTSCCPGGDVDAQSQQLGYTDADVDAVPEGANMGLGCGNPQAIAALKPGETVLDLGSGGGFDCFLAAKQVGRSGHVIGVDMTADMITRARANLEKSDATNVEFRLGEIEHLPVADQAIDVILSNCVINLSPDKPAVYREAFRVLRSGGRLAISDVVATAELPEKLRDDLKAHTSCLAGAVEIPALERILGDAGFIDIRVVPIAGSRKLIREWMPGLGLEDCVVSANVEAVRP